MKNVRRVSFCSFVLALVFSSAAASAQQIELDKYLYSPGEAITVSFNAPNNFADNAWIGIIPSHIQHGSEAVNDSHDLAYQHLKKRTSGTLTFKAPSTEGSYDFRMHDTDSNGREVASVSFTVTSTISAGYPTLTLDKTTVKPGQDIQVHFTAAENFADNAWIGIIPSHVRHGSEPENDSHDLSYQHLRKRASGTLTFKAPSKEGAYDFRMHDTDNRGMEVASVSFTVTSTISAGYPTLTLDKTTVKPGQEIQVHFTAAENFADNAWIGIIPSHVRHGSEPENDSHDLSYQHLRKRASGTLTFKAPSKEGAYDFRMHDTDNRGMEVASVSFTVTSTISAGYPTLTLDKTTVKPGQEIQVHFTAAENFADNAWIGIIPSHVEHGSEPVNDSHDLSYQHLRKRASGTLTFKAPSKEGAYDFRMHDTDNKGREVASVSFVVAH